MRNRLKVKDKTEAIALIAILSSNGYATKMVKAKQEGYKTAQLFVEYWEE